MPRGRLLKSKVKEAYELAKAGACGKADGEAAGQLRKKVGVSAKEHLGKLIDRITIDDTIKLSAWIGLAYLIKPIIVANNDVQAKINIIKAERHFGAKVATLGSSTMTEPFATIANWVTVTIAEAGGVFTEEQKQSIMADIAKHDIENWLLAFVTSAIIVTFGAVILQSFGGVGGLARLLIT